MQVFIVGTPLATAMALDSRRLNKQIIECGQILDALNGKKAWSNHPCVLQYRKHKEWLNDYMRCLVYYQCGNIDWAEKMSDICEWTKPKFHIPEYFEQMKRRLYTKNNEYYKQWKYLGTSDVNWYWSHEKQEFIKYKNGKRILS